VGWAVNPAADLDLPAAYTNYGQSVIDLAAPGGNGDSAHFSYEVELGGVTLRCFVFDMVLSTSSRFSQTGPYEPNGTWAWGRGTSMAAPHVDYPWIAPPPVVASPVRNGVRKAPG
jgi:subtilisin family serine protease